MRRGGIWLNIHLSQMHGDHRKQSKLGDVQKGFYSGKCSTMQSQQVLLFSRSDNYIEIDRIMFMICRVRDNFKVAMPML